MIETAAAATTATFIPSPISLAPDPADDVLDEPTGADAGSAVGRLSDDELVTSFGLLLEAGLKLRRQVGTELESAGLRIEFFDVLVRLVRSPGHRMPMSRLATELGYSPGGMTRLADRMVTEGLLTRTTDRSDRRLVLAQLTDAGRTRATEVWPDHLVQLRRIYADVLGDADARQLAALTRRLRDWSGADDRGTGDRAADERGTDERGTGDAGPDCAAGER